MAFMSITAWAADLDVTKFTAANISYGSAALGAVTNTQGLTAGTDYTVETTKFYTGVGTGETAIASLATASIGTYYTKVTGIGAYNGQTIYVSFHVVGISVTIDFNAVSKTYGETDADHPITYTLSGGVTKEQLGLTVSRAAGEDVKTGGYAYSFTWTNTNYSLTRVTTDADVFTINPKNISSTATATALKTTMVYTGKDAAGIYSVKNGETALVEGTDWTMAATKNVGTSLKPTITFKGNYTGSLTPSTGFDITAAPITVSIEDIEETYDGVSNYANQSSSSKLKINYSGIVGDDVANANAIKLGFTRPTTVAVASGTAIDAGTYTLAISNDGGTGSYTNYTFKTWVPGKLTVKKAEIKLKANNATKHIGEDDPVFTLAIPASITAAGQTVTGVTFTRESGETEGEYKITPNISAAKVMTTGLSPVDKSANYDLKVDDAKGVLTIGKSGITVIVKDAEKKYGAADPTFTYKAVGLAEGDEDKLTVNITRTAGETPGKAYALTATVTNPDATKYSGVTVVDGALTINKAQLEFTIPAQNVATNVDKTALKKDGITVTGINNSDAAADLYDLDFFATLSPGDGGASITGGKTTIDETAAKGIKVTLKSTTVKVDGVDKPYTDLYEIVTDKTTNPWTVSTTTYGKLIVGDGTTAAITFTSVDADYATITGQAGEKQTVSLKIDNRTREIPAGTAHSWAAQTWNAMVLPFEVTVAELSSKLGYGIVNRVDATKTTEGNVVFKLEMDKIPANEPFCIKTTGAIADGTTINFTARKIVAPGSEYPSVDAGQGYKFVGVYKTFTINNSKPDYYFLRGDNAKWARIKSSSENTWKMVPFDAYIDQTGAASARELTFTFQELDGSYTAIKSIAADVNDEGAAKTGWYNLNGMKLQSAPVQKGVYIHNGKKVIVK